MKKVFFIIILSVIGYILIRGSIFIFNNFRGVSPVLMPPPGNISDKIGGKDSSPKPGENTTGFPLSLPPGFSITVFAQNLGDPRVIVQDPVGIFLVSIPSRGSVVALVDTNRDGVSDKQESVVTGLYKPHGLTFRDGNLYIAEENQVAIWNYDQKTLRASGKHKILDLPPGGNHTTRTIGFGPDGKLYITIGSSCNVCTEKDPRRAKMYIANSDGSGFTEYASGLRNTVFFIWHPVTGMLWGTDMGRDLIGDDRPPDEINIINQGKFYGWPHCYSKNIHDDIYNVSQKSRDFCQSAQASYIDIPAHSAPLGLAFIPANESWPADYRNNLLVAYHGSWNRSVPTGYKIVRFKLDSQGVYSGQQDFISGWLTPNGALGRPVDLIFDDKGILYLTDDKAGVVYRILPPRI